MIFEEIYEIHARMNHNTYTCLNSLLSYLDLESRKSELIDTRMAMRNPSLAPLVLKEVELNGCGTITTYLFKKGYMPNVCTNTNDIFDVVVFIEMD